MSEIILSESYLYSMPSYIIISEAVSSSHTHTAVYVADDDICDFYSICLVLFKPADCIFLLFVFT